MKGFCIDYLNQSPRLITSSSPLSAAGFERALTPGLKTHPTPPTPLHHTYNNNNNPTPPQQRQESTPPPRQSTETNQFDAESSLSSPPSEPVPAKPTNSKNKNKIIKTSPSRLHRSNQSGSKQTEDQTNILSHISFKRKKENQNKSSKRSNQLTKNKPSQKRLKVSDNPTIEDQTKSSPNNEQIQLPTTLNNANESDQDYVPPTSSKTNTIKKNSTNNTPSSNSTIKKPIKTSLKKSVKPSTTTKLKPITSNSNNNLTALLHSQNNTNNNTKQINKNKEFDLNNPQTWGALFGGGDKKPVAKPVKPGNLPPQAALSYNGTSMDRLEARKKQRLEEKKTLLDHSKYGFDLLRQNLVMMDFEIEYKNHVRAMVEKPIESHSMITATTDLPVQTTNQATSNSKITNEVEGNVRGLGQSIGSKAPTNVLYRSDGYKRYLNPQSNSLVDPSAPSLGFHLQQPPGPIYSSSNSADPNSSTVSRKILPRPGMFGSTFFIWQSHHLS